MDTEILNIPIPVPLLIFAAVSVLALIAIIKSDPASEPALTGPRQRPTITPGGPMGLPRISYIELPVLPGHLRYWGISTEVVLEFIVNKAGKATQIRMVRASHAEMVRPCMEAIKHATFLPARNANQEPIESPMVFPVHAASPSMSRPRPLPHRPSPAMAKLSQAS